MLCKNYIPWSFICHPNISLNYSVRVIIVEFILQRRWLIPCAFKGCHLPLSVVLRYKDHRSRWRSEETNGDEIRLKMTSTDFSASSPRPNSSQYIDDKTTYITPVISQNEGFDIDEESRKGLERKLVRKVDWRLCTIAGILCSLNLMDSGIISSASVANDFFTDLGLGVGNRYVSSHTMLSVSSRHGIGTDEANTVVCVNSGLHRGKCNVPVASYTLCEDVWTAFGILIDHNWLWHYHHGMTHF